MELIEGVAALVDHGIQGGGHLIGEIVGGDADVVTGEVDGEGVLRLADDAVVSVDVHDIHDEVGELALDRHGVVPVQGASSTRSAWAVTCWISGTSFSRREEKKASHWATVRPRSKVESMVS